MDSYSLPYTFSQRAQQLTSSTIREILKVTEWPEVISFAGGLPAPGGFPVEEINAAFDRVLQRNGNVALQYGGTEDYTPLREWVADDCTRRRGDATLDAVLIVTGSQLVLDRLGKLVIDPGSKVLVEAPSYLPALQSLSLFEPQYAAVPTDEGGLIPERITEDVAD